MPRPSSTRFLCDLSDHGERVANRFRSIGSGEHGRVLIALIDTQLAEVVDGIASRFPIAPPLPIAPLELLVHPAVLHKVAHRLAAGRRDERIPVN